MNAKTRMNLTDVEAAERYGLSRAWFQRKRWEGGGPVFIKMPGKAGRVLYPIESLDAYFEARLRVSTSDLGPVAKTAQANGQVARVRKLEVLKETPSAGCSLAVGGEGVCDE